MYFVINSDAIKGLQQLPDESVDCCITSPPYYNLRDYGVENQIGLEKTPQEYISKLVAVFKEVKRVLKKDGTLWINIADSYAGSGKGASKYPQSGKQETNIGSLSPNCSCTGGGVKPKNLIGIPWMLAFALRDEVEEKYDNSEIILDADDFESVEIYPSGTEERILDITTTFCEKKCEYKHECDEDCPLRRIERVLEGV